MVLGNLTLLITPSLRKCACRRETGMPESCPHGPQSGVAGPPHRLLTHYLQWVSPPAVRGQEGEGSGGRKFRWPSPGKKRSSKKVSTRSWGCEERTATVPSGGGGGGGSRRKPGHSRQSRSIPDPCCADPLWIPHRRDSTGKGGGEHTIPKHITP